MRPGNAGSAARLSWPPTPTAAAACRSWITVPKPPSTKIIKGQYHAVRTDRLAQGKSPEYRAAAANIVYEAIVGVLKAPDGDRFIVVNEHKPENLIYDPDFLGMKRSPDFMLIQVTSTVGNTKELKLAFYRQIVDEFGSKVGQRPDDVMIDMVFVDREDWSFGKGQPW